MNRATLATLAFAGTLAACGQGASGGAASPPVPTAEVRALLQTLPAKYQAADLENGAAHFSLCRSCHTITKGGANMTGPNLYGVFGRRAAAKADYSYSEALKAKGLTWDADTLNQWLSGPQAFVPGTKMAFPGLKDETDRRDVIGYLKVASSGGPS
jgi:cytochrome c